MKVTRVIAIAVMMASSTLAVSHAQNLRNAEDAPAEFPPASFKGKQYVDSRGCIYIRAGIDGNTTWVPRVNRSRNQVCGAQPTLSGQVATAAAAAAKPAEAPVQITFEPAAQTAAAAAPAPKPKALPKPTPVNVRQPAAAPKPKPRVVAKAAPRPAPAPRPVARRKVVTAPKPVVITPTPAPAPKVAAPVKAAPVPVRRQAACSGASALSSQYINSGARTAVRCGPQAVPVRRAAAAQPAPRRVQAQPQVRRVPAQTQATAVRRPAQVATARTGLTGQTRVVPRHVYTDRLNTQFAPVPKGYRRVWEDDRLNPRRAEQSLNGHARTTLLWTSTVPRRLINQTNGRDVTAQVPLVYPYTDIETQQRQLGTVTLERRNGVLVKRIQRNTASATSRYPTVSSRSAPKPAAVAPKPVTRAAPKAATARSGERISGKGYVQLGVFSTSASAQSAAQRMMRMGMPARIGKFNRGGRELRMVLVGPFASARAQRTALSQARGAGFGSAKLR